jgi:hypothetical protein
MNDETLNKFIKVLESQYNFFNTEGDFGKIKEYYNGSRDAYNYVLATLREFIENE